MKEMKRSKGFTLVELLVGLVVSTAVLGTIAGVFVPSMSTYRGNQAVASLQENQRYLIGAVSSAVDQAGFIGCDSREPANVVNATTLPGATANTATWLRDFTAPVRVIPAGTSAAAYIGGTFILTLHDSAAETVTFRGDLLSELDGKVITINDCRNTAVFEIGAGVVNAATGTTPTTTTFSYSAANTNNCTGGGTTRVLLGSSNPDNTFVSTRLVAGVDNMRIRYGIRKSSGGIEYRTAPNFSGNQNIDGSGLPETYADVVAIEATFLLNSGLARGVRGNTEVQTFNFPPVDGTADITCDGTQSGNNESSACPIYLSNTALSRGQLRRVVKKTFNLRNITL